MNRTQKILATFAVAAAAIANGAAHAQDQSKFFDCSRQITDGAAMPCPTPEADRAEATFLRKAEAQAKRWEHATAAHFHKTETTEVEHARSSPLDVQSDVNGQ
jgi:hypothetical protein